MKQQPKKCKYCGATFTPERRNGLYCSKTCRQYSYLERKTGESYPKVREEEEDPNVAPLVFENEEGKTLHSVNLPSKEYQPIASTPHQKPSIVEFSNKGFMLIDGNSIKKNQNENVNDTFIPQKDEGTLLQDEVQSIRQELEMMWTLKKPTSKEMKVIMEFGKRLRPYLQALLFAHKQELNRQKLYQFNKELQRLGQLYLPVNNCPLLYPPVDFFINYLEEGLNQFFVEKGNTMPRFEFQLSEGIKIRVKALMLLIGKLKPNTKEVSEII